MLNERTRRLWAASEAQALGHGGIAVVARATGLSRTRIARGLQELRSDAPLDPGRVRRPGGGRKRRIDTDVTLLSDLNALVEPVTAGAPDDSPLRWTSKSTRKLAAELQALGHSVSPGLVGGLLHELGYTLQECRTVALLVSCQTLGREAPRNSKMKANIPFPSVPSFGSWNSP